MEFAILGRGGGNALVVMVSRYERNVGDGWTPERDAELKRLWNLGWTASKIGEKMGCTRNAVIGRSRRMGLVRRRNPTIKTENPSPESLRKRHQRKEGKHAHKVNLKATNPLKVKTAVVAAPAPKATQAVPRAVGGGSCQWTDSDRAPWVFCDQAAVEARPYCEAHCARAYAGFGKGAE